MKNNLLLNVSKITPKFLNREPFMNKLGFIISKKYDCIINYPTKSNSHEVSSYEMLKEVYDDLIAEGLMCIEKLKSKMPNQICCVDQPEMGFAMFFASLGEIVFLNTSNAYYKSGLLFLPADLSLLSINQLKALNHCLTIIKTFNNCEAAFVTSYYNKEELSYKSLSIEEVEKILTSHK